MKALNSYKIDLLLKPTVIIISLSSSDLGYIFSDQKKALPPKLNWPFLSFSFDMGSIVWRRANLLFATCLAKALFSRSKVDRVVELINWKIEVTAIPRISKATPTSSKLKPLLICMMLYFNAHQSKAIYAQNSFLIGLNCFNGPARWLTRWIKD